MGHGTLEKPIMAYRIAGLWPETFARPWRSARLAAPGQTEAKILDLFANPEIAYIEAHCAAYGGFAARVERHEGEAA